MSNFSGKTLMEARSTDDAKLFLKSQIFQEAFFTRCKIPYLDILTDSYVFDLMIEHGLTDDNCNQSDSTKDFNNLKNKITSLPLPAQQLLINWANYTVEEAKNFFNKSSK